MVLFKKKVVLGFCFILLCVLGAQLSKIQRPYTGHFASYQGTVMGGIAQNFLRENFSQILLPKTNSIIGNERSLHLNQYPFPSLVAALAARYLSGTLEFWGRFQAVLFNLFSIGLLGLIGKRLFGERVGLLAAAIFALSPYTILYGQSFMSEPHALCFFLIALVCLIPEPEEKTSFGAVILSALFFSVVLTARVHWLVFYPLFFCLILLAQSAQKILQLLVFMLLSVMLPVVWYGYTYFVSMQADNVHTTLFMQLFADKVTSNTSMLLSFTYYQALARLLIGRYFSIILLPLAFWGVLQLDKKKGHTWFLLGGLALNLVLILLAPDKILKHDFYLYGCFPFVVLSAAYGMHALLERFKIIQQSFAIVFVGLIYFALSCALFIRPIFTEPEVELQMVSVAAKIQDKIPPEEKIVIFSDFPGVFTYYAARAVWTISGSAIGKPLSPYEKVKGIRSIQSQDLIEREAARKDAVTWLESLRAKGAAYLVAPLRRELDQMPLLQNYLDAHFELLSVPDDDFYLYGLTLKQD